MLQHTPLHLELILASEMGVHDGCCGVVGREVGQLGEDLDGGADRGEGKSGVETNRELLEHVGTLGKLDRDGGIAVSCFGVRLVALEATRQGNLDCGALKEMILDIS